MENDSESVILIGSGTETNPNKESLIEKAKYEYVPCCMMWVNVVVFGTIITAIIIVVIHVAGVF